MIAVWDFLAVLCDCLQFVIMTFPDHTHLLCFADFNRFRLSVFYVSYWCICDWSVVVYVVAYSGRIFEEKRYLVDHVKHTCRVPFMMVWPI